MASRDTFHSLYTHGFVRAAVCVPAVRVADPAYNVAQTLSLAKRASDACAAVVLFPELGLSAYSNEDLFHQEALLQACEDALEELVQASHQLQPLLLVGAPVRVAGRLFNCAIAIHGGRILGILPKSYLPNYREFYEKRQFCAARDALESELSLLGQRVPFGNDLLFEFPSLPGLTVHAEICEDLWVPIPPSTLAALGGATLLTNLSASNVTIGKMAYRRELCRAQSGKCIAAYLYSAAGFGESTTDLAWDGHAMIYENGALLGESERFSSSEQITLADIDLDRLLAERMRMTSFHDLATERRAELARLRRVVVPFAPPKERVALQRNVERYPYVPSGAEDRDERCYEAYNIQVHGLMKRLRATGLERVVIGVSGGLDSTHALIVCARTMDRLGLPRSNVLAYSLPGLATSERTRSNARKLMDSLGVQGREIDIQPACRQRLADLDHPASRGEPMYDVTFENVQAGERTSLLFRLANQQRALVVGTGDLSELALGWCTYGVGDHMSHYAVNASVPKTLIQHLIRWVAAKELFGTATSAVLRSVLDTPISPELLPGDGASDGPAQSTEASIGPYALQDFHLYYTSRFGFRPSKVAFLAFHAWSDLTRGAFPEGMPEAERRSYSLGEIRRWLEVFLVRFFQQSQFKRSCLPNAPKVGSGGSLSPRSDWRAPSDAEATPWLDELRANVPDN